MTDLPINNCTELTGMVTELKIAVWHPSNLKLDEDTLQPFIDEAFKHGFKVLATKFPVCQGPQVVFEVDVRLFNRGEKTIAQAGRSFIGIAKDYLNWLEEERPT